MTCSTSPRNYFLESMHLFLHSGGANLFKPAARPNRKSEWLMPLRDTGNFIPLRLPSGLLITDGVNEQERHGCCDGLRAVKL